MIGPAQKLNKAAHAQDAKMLNEINLIWIELLEKEEIAFKNSCMLDKECPDKSAEKSDAV